MARFKVPRSYKSKILANIILSQGLFNDWRIFCYKHPKIKSKYRSANLFLLHRKLRYVPVERVLDVNMDTIVDYYYG